MIKAAFFDIDGTILSHKQHAVPQSTIRALEQLREKGIHCVIATGRHMREIRRLDLTALQFDGYVTLNGQICCDRDGTVFFDQPFPMEELGPLVDMFRKQEFSVAMVEQERMYCNFVSESMVKAHSLLSIPLMAQEAYHGEQLYQVIVYADEAETRKFFPQMPPCRMTRWNPYGIDMIPTEGGKVLGIRQMLDHLGLSREEIIAFGDGDNDDEMLKYAGIGVAMGNSTPQCRAAADYVAEDIEADGLALALRHFGLI